MHSTASDGTFDPRELVIAAKNAGLSIIAITDHDTIDGIEDACRAGNEYGIKVIPGIELSTTDGKKEIHILGYYIDPANQYLKNLITQMINAREMRAINMVQKLNDIGIEITVDRVFEISGTTFIGRPHIARAMQEMGYIKEQSEAFTKNYIGNGGRAYVDRFKIKPVDAISIIHEAGGIAVLAHPGYLADRSSLDEGDLVRYFGCGLDGVEVFYSKHTEEQVEYYLRIVIKYGMVITKGSDFHGREGESLSNKKTAHSPY